MAADRGCQEFERLWVAGEPLSPEMLEHVRSCPLCGGVYGLSRRIEEPPPIAPELEAKLVAAIQDRLEPVKPLAGTRGFTLAMLGVAAGVAALALLKLGVTGWRHSGTALRLYLGGWLLAGLWITAAHLAKLMIPGAPLRFRPAALAAVTGAGVLSAVVFYPFQFYEHFARAALTCFAIGMSVALPTGFLTNLILRRGFVTGAASASLLGGLFAGFTALVVLFMFCPHLDAGHYLVAHLAAVAGSIGLGRAFLRT